MRKRYWWLLILLLAPSLVLAKIDSIPAITSDAVVKNTDLSMSYLGMIFGDVGNVLTSSTGTMMPYIIGIFNQGVVIIASMILGYGIVMMIFRASTEATFMAANRNTYMIVTRIAVGFALLIPLGSGFSGYSSLQIILMKVVKYSVQLADQTWEKSLNTYMAQGGRVVQTSFYATARSGSGILDSNYLNKLLLPDSNEVFSSTGDNTDMQTFIDKHNDYINNYNSISGNSFLQKILLLQVCMFEHHLKTGDNLFPIQATTSLNFPSSLKSPAGCGYIDTKALTKLMGAGGVYTQPQIVNFVMGLANNLSSGAKQYVCSLRKYKTKYDCQQISMQTAGLSETGGSGGVSPKIKTMASGLYSGFTDYTAQVRKVMNQSLAKTDRGAFDFVKTAKQNGWVTAGSFYWNLIKNHNNATEKQEYDSKVNSGLVVNNITPPNMSETLAKASVAAAYKIENSIATNRKGQSSEVSPAKAGLMQLTGVIGVILGPAAQVLVDLAKIFARFSAWRMGTDPIVWLTGLGSLFIDLSASMFFAFMIGNFLTLLPFIAGRLFADPLGLLEEAYNWIRPVIISVAAAYLMIGVTLQFMVPLYPFMVFTFGVISWFALLIEAMIAMPLVAMGITHPEGHDFLGKAEQAIMLLLGVFLRPVLMIMGLIAGIVLSQVALKFIIWGFSTFIIDLFNPGATRSLLDPHTDPLLASTTAAWGWMMLNKTTLWSLPFRFLIVIPVLFYIFQDMVYQVVKACYNMVFILPDFIMKWVGGPQQTGGSISAAKSAEAVSQATVGREGALTQMKGQAEQLATNYLHGQKEGGIFGDAKDNDYDMSKKSKKNDAKTKENIKAAKEKIKDKKKSIWKSLSGGGGTPDQDGDIEMAEMGGKPEAGAGKARRNAMHPGMPGPIIDDLDQPTPITSGWTPSATPRQDQRPAPGPPTQSWAELKEEINNNPPPPPPASSSPPPPPSSPPPPPPPSSPSPPEKKDSSKPDDDLGPLDPKNWE